MFSSKLAGGEQKALKRNRYDKNVKWEIFWRKIPSENVCANRLVNGSMKNRACWGLISFGALELYVHNLKSITRISHTRERWASWKHYLIPPVCDHLLPSVSCVFAQFTVAAWVIYSTRKFILLTLCDIFFAFALLGNTETIDKHFFATFFYVAAFFKLKERQKYREREHKMKKKSFYALNGINP